ncbi:SusF/SusE family outer membrane protein [Flavobacterium cupreum]|uniref:SusF/SusE family outer membrane protein n=1 Tax=Flavobacterium cupreum TaxID=2133766 RepID=A0A434A9U7_9FLAO|nr:SusE domain-containing protein [Flavobacterium cupreum]RUT71150.1 SusF/SusE family outer membrane protein [Flavobacterium cupreum]
MKNSYKILIAFIGVLLVSCNADDVENRPVVDAGTAPVLLTPLTGFSIVLSKETAKDIATTVTWNKATYTGQQTVVNYTIQIAKAGTNFANPSTVSNTTANSKELTVEELNSAVLNGGFTPYQSNDVDVRIKSVVGATGLPQYSNAFTIKVTPYAAWANWGLIGSATPNGWNDPDTDLNYDLATKKYSYVGPLTVGEIKFRLDDGWAVNYGDDGNDKKLDAGGANIPITSAGNYTVIVDIANKEYTIQKN